MIDETVERVCAFIYGKIRQKKTTQRKLAKIIHVSPSRFCQKLKKGDFTLRELVLIFAVLEATEREIGEAIHVKEYRYSL